MCSRWRDFLVETEGWVCVRKTWGGSTSRGEGTRLCSLPGVSLTCWTVVCPPASAAHWRWDTSSTSYRHRSLWAISVTNSYEFIKHRTLIKHLLVLHTALLSQSVVLLLNTYLMSASFVLIHSNTPKQQQLKHRFLQLVQSCSCMIIFSPSCCLLQEVRFQESWSFSLVQTNFQEQILMEKYDVIPFSDGGNNVEADCRTPDFTISVLKFKVWHTIRW